MSDPIKGMTAYHQQTLMNRMLGRRRPVTAANLGPISNLPKMPAANLGPISNLPKMHAANLGNLPVPAANLGPAVNTVTVTLPKTSTVADNTITVPLPETHLRYTTTVPLPNKPCTRLSFWQKGSLLLNHDTIDLSYDSPLYCELLTKIDKRGRLSTLSWAEIDRVLPDLDPKNPIVEIKVGGKKIGNVNLAGFLKAVKTVKVTGHELTTAQILEFFLGLRTKYPLLNPTTLIIDKCDGRNDSEVFISLQDKLRRIIPNITLKTQAGGRRTRRRKSRKSRKSRKARHR